jgi:hypothetical protein
MKPHTFDPVSFFAGLVISGIGLLFLLPREPGDIFDFIGNIGAWFWPVLLLTIGGAILAPIVFRRPAQDQEEGED